MSSSPGILETNFDPATLARARPYVAACAARITEQKATGLDIVNISASVFGTAPKPYRQEVSVNLDLGEIDGTCSCPVGHNCKHVAAVVMAALGIDHEPDIKPRGATPASAAHAAPLPYHVEAWLLDLAKAERAESDVFAADILQRVLYLIEPTSNASERDFSLALKQARVLKSGTYGAASNFGNSNTLYNPPRFMQLADLRILRELVAGTGSSYGFRFAVKSMSARLLEAIIATKRAHWRDKASPPLQWGAPRNATVTWETFANGDCRTKLDLQPDTLPLATTPPTYLDLTSLEVGLIETGMKPMVAAAIIAAPALPALLVARVSEEIQTRKLHHLVTPPAPMEERLLADYQPTPVLLFATHRQEYLDTRTWRHTASFVDSVQLSFDYLGELVAAKLPSEVTRVVGRALERVTRRYDLEKAARSELRATGLEPVEKVFNGAAIRNLQGRYALRGGVREAAAVAAWTAFVTVQIPLLRERGFRIVMDASFRFNLVQVDDWYADVEESENAWFDLEIGIQLDGQRVSLIPILVKLIRTTPGEWKGDTLAARRDDEQVLVPLPDGRRASLPIGRIRPLITTLYELFMREPTGKLRLATLDAGRLAEMEDALKCRWIGGERLRDLGARLARFTHIAPVATPKSFQATLRGYQSEGLAWLQFLREYDLGGILADDMGLGKTVQALAHIVCEKADGRLGTPALVVAPTSMIPTWQAEAARFAPSLKVWVSHGGKRHDGGEALDQYDLVLTTYALLSRDVEVLKATHWHLLILDEAQNIKNPKTKAAAIACTLRAKHRLCLSGTPLENHLGELWSLFQFLLPGFLGDERSFQRDYRKPIEKDLDTDRRKFLARRIKPFMLRRTKDAVAHELPAKTLITRVVEMESQQSDLYETIRAAMDKRVREEIAAKGLAKSHIVVLDALLKLRQVCCDPRLLKSTSTTAAPSAKLQGLMEMLSELLEAGRHILLFSQFTSMLELIEAELDSRNITYAKLTGSTRDRAAPINAFQSGHVKLFLISLKAGGTGLTLTAADTVIHYDPWWNPAVENQATDRAHRIGQTKPVFVYKLITKGTVEERIVELQSRKGALASALLGGEAKAASALAAEDLKALFEPLPLM